MKKHMGNKRISEANPPKKKKIGIEGPLSTCDSFSFVHVFTGLSNIKFCLLWAS